VQPLRRSTTVAGDAAEGRRGMARRHRQRARARVGVLRPLALRRSPGGCCDDGERDEADQSPRANFHRSAAALDERVPGHLDMAQGSGLMAYARAAVVASLFLGAVMPLGDYT